MTVRSNRKKLLEIEQKLDNALQRIDALSYLVKRLVMNKKIEDKQVKVLDMEISSSVG